MPPNWSALVEQGRAKALGVSWDDEELNAIYQLKIPVEFVREGCLTLEAYQKAQGGVDQSVRETKKKPLRYMNKPELLLEAEAAGVHAGIETTRNELMDLISKKLEGLTLPAGSSGQESVGS